MSNGLNKRSVRKEQKALSTQIEELQQVVRELQQNQARLLFSINEKHQAIATDMQQLRDTANATVKATGLADQVRDLMAAAATDRKRAQAAEEKAALEKGIEDGYMVPAEVVGPNSMIVGKYVDADGKDVEPGRVQYFVRALEGSFQEKLANQKAGAEIEVEGGKFLLQEIYGIDVQKMRDLQLRLQQAAAEQAAQRAAAVDAGADAPKAN